MRKLSFFLFSFFIVFTAFAAKPKATNVITRIVGDQTIAVQHYNSGIVRVTKYLGTTQPEKKSYSVILEPQAVGSDALQVIIDDEGRVSFSTANGELLLRETEKATFTRRTTGVDAGKYEVSQTWRLADDEAIFGLGQIADEQMNKRGKSIKFWNTNTYTPIHISPERRATACSGTTLAVHSSRTHQSARLSAQRWL